MSTEIRTCPSGDEKVVLVGLLLETNARLVRRLSSELESECAIALPWFEVLLQLRKSPDGRLKMSQIADAIVHSTGGTTRLIDRLEEAGHVQRQLCPNDRRAVHVAITALGNSKLDEALAVHLTFLNTHVAGRLSEGERRQLSSLLHKLNGSS